MAHPLRKPVFEKLKEVEPMRHYNLVVKVLSVVNKAEIKRIDAEPVKMAIVLVGDETASARLLLKNAQIAFAEPGAGLVLRNAHARVVKERIRLEVDIWGKIEKATVLLPSFLRPSPRTLTTRTTFPMSSMRP